MVKWIQDAGHGGTDPGATANGHIEKEYTLEAALYVQKRLQDHGIASDITRTTDKTLSVEERTNMVKKYKRCISHHFNAGGGSGLECIHSIYADGKFEQMIVEEFKKAGYPVRPRPVFSKKNSKGQDWYYMHRQTGNCRTTIIEYDFLDGANSNKLKDKKYREGMYECVVKAICRLEGVEYKPLNQPAKQNNSSDIIYRVQVGAFGIRENAEKMLEKVRKAGFDGFITTNASMQAPAQVKEVVKEVKVKPTVKLLTYKSAVTKGTKGNHVKELQKVLKQLGYYKDAIDGSAGNNTVNAIKAFQKDFGLAVDGSAGPATYNMLNKVLSSCKKLIENS